ncbi:hypothetical protein Q1695_000801 [Nippostrongylus brasiliensis]|nr:hypothetical protein Q1695_000801 [Nippostrongylus brasiliensis]
MSSFIHISNFSRVCFKLYILAKQIRRNNQLAAKLREKIERKRKSGDTAPIENSTWKQQLSIGVAQQIIQTLNIEVGNGNAIQVAPDHWQEPKNVAPCDVEEDNETAQTDDDGRPQLLAYKPNASSRRGSTDTVISSSFDISDIETHIDTRNMYEQDRLDSVDISGVEEWILQKYRPLLRFFNFLLFREYSKKLRRLRKSDRLIEIEAEIREQENTRNQHLRELELRVNAMLGKPSTSSLSPTSNEKLCLSRRLDMCEAKMGEMENTMARINELIVDLTAILGDNPPQQVFLSTPSDRQAQSPSRSASDVSGEN